MWRKCSCQVQGEKKIGGKKGKVREGVGGRKGGECVVVRSKEKRGKEVRKERWERECLGV